MSPADTYTDRECRLAASDRARRTVLVADLDRRIAEVERLIAGATPDAREGYSAHLADLRASRSATRGVTRRVS